jgi:hypothetical protein
MDGQRSQSCKASVYLQPCIYCVWVGRCAKPACWWQPENASWKEHSCRSPLFVEGAQTCCTTLQMLCFCKRDACLIASMASIQRQQGWRQGSPNQKPIILDVCICMRVCMECLDRGTPTCPRALEPVHLCIIPVVASEKWLAIADRGSMWF